MSSLNASLAIALSGLTAEQGALQVTTNNISNVNTPGYSRQVPNLVSSALIVVDPLTLGSGVTLKSNAALESYPYLLEEINAALGNPYTPTSSNTTPTAGSSTSGSSSSTG